MTVGQLARTMTSAELTHWIAFNRVEPFGQAVDDYRAGIAAAIYVNAHRGEDKDPIVPNVLFPWNELVAEEPRVQTPEEIAAAAIGVFDRVTGNNA